MRIASCIVVAITSTMAIAAIAVIREIGKYVDELYQDEEDKDD